MIGKKGAIIKKIQEETKTRIKSRGIVAAEGVNWTEFAIRSDTPEGAMAARRAIELIIDW